jgi:hypothetical protein
MRARLLAVEIGPDDIDVKHLTAAQDSARQGFYAAAMSGYLRWLAPRLDEVRKKRKEMVEAIRSEVNGGHRRTATTTGEMLAGLRFFLIFAEECGAISATDSDELMTKADLALRVAAEGQREHLVVHEPAAQFIALLKTALASGKGHVALKDGGVPDQPGAWGWRVSGYDSPRAQGARIGWVDDNGLYLDSGAAFTAAHEVARSQGETLPLGLPTLRKRLHERKHLMTTDLVARGTHDVRRMIEGTRHDVLHLRRDALGFDDASVDPDQTDQPDQSVPEEDSGRDGRDGRVSPLFGGFREAAASPETEEVPF